MQVPGLVFGGAIYRSFFGGGRYEFGVGFGRLCSKKKHIILLAVLISFFYFLKIMLSVTEIRLLRLRKTKIISSLTLSF